MSTETTEETAVESTASASETAVEDTTTTTETEEEESGLSEFLDRLETALPLVSKLVGSKRAKLELANAVSGLKIFRVLLGK